MKFWDDTGNCRSYSDWFGETLGIKKLDDWYKISISDIESNIHSTLWYKYGYYLPSILAAAYPEHHWKQWKFISVSNGYWNNDANLREFIQSVATELHIQKLEDWYRVSLKQIETVAPLTPFRKFGGLGQLLQHVYPHYKWDMQKFYMKVMFKTISKNG